MKIFKNSILWFSCMIILLVNTAFGLTLKFVQTDPNPRNHHNPYNSYTHVLSIKVVTKKQEFTVNVAEPLSLQDEGQLKFANNDMPTDSQSMFQQMMATSSAVGHFDSQIIVPCLAKNITSISVRMQVRNSKTGVRNQDWHDVRINNLELSGDSYLIDNGMGYGAVNLTLQCASDNQIVNEVMSDIGTKLMNDLANQLFAIKAAQKMNNNRADEDDSKNAKNEDDDGCVIM